jgi:hypothetical protein
LPILPIDNPPRSGEKPPPGWILEQTRADGARWINNKRQMVVIGSIAIEDDGKKWLHMSMSHRKRVPTYDELIYLKRNWIGEDRKAIMVLPEKEKHINIHPFVLHLFCCLDGDPLPDFTQGGDTI